MKSQARQLKKQQENGYNGVSGRASGQGKKLQQEEVSCNSFLHNPSVPKCTLASLGGGVGIGDELSS